MGILSSFLGLCGFGLGITIGIVFGYFLFIYFQPNDVKDPIIQPLVQQDSASLQDMLPELPLWVKNPDYERVDWLNKFLEKMWPHLEKAVCMRAMEIAKPIIFQNIEKLKIESVEFEAHTLGTLPPTFSGIKVYITDEKELMMEPILKWAGNPNVMLAVKAFGLKATIQVVDLQVFAAPRITLKPLVPSFPCFSNVSVSLMEKPHVDFGLKFLGADVLSIPGLYRYVQEFIKDQVANLYLWPRTLEIPILDPTRAEKRPVGILHVKVLKASNLRKKDLLGKADPYVKLKLSEEKLPSKKTKVKRNNLNPEWNEEFNLVGKHERMGMNVIPLKILIPEKTKLLKLDLLKNMNLNDPQNEKSRGQLMLDLAYKPFQEEDSMQDSISKENVVQKTTASDARGGGLLVAIIHAAHDVEGKHHTNPYARLLFRGEERKTKHIKKNRDPRWEDEFEYMLEEPPINEKMHIEIISKRPRIGLRSKELLGYVDINLMDVVQNKRINENYHLIDSKHGRLHVELQWRT